MPHEPFTAMTPMERLHAAIGILQQHVLAQDTALNREKLWPGVDYTGPAIESAIHLLMPLAEHLDGVCSEQK